ncbi:MAG: hypothetical protein GY715_01875 [Planctomycetes bacterium]|nr:hypothetical protein [Planctomycetota bacterium]
MRWRSCLEQIHQRNGSIEIAVARVSDRDGEGSHLVWRVRVLGIDETNIVVEQPTALGASMCFRPGIAFVAIMTVGQNRWMFRTKNVGTAEHRGSPALQLEMPQSVQRCQRRHHDRVLTAALTLPEVDLWPLMDPKSVLLAERANELRLAQGIIGAGVDDIGEDDDLLPEVGPRFTGLLLNVGGGGVGLLVPPEHNQVLTRHKIFWTRIALPPELDVPICASAKLVHTHMQSDHQIYAGMAFDFSFNAGHQRFVVDQITRYVTLQQRGQLDAA